MKKYWDKIKRTKTATVWKPLLINKILVAEKNRIFGGWNLDYGRPDTTDFEPLGNYATRREVEKAARDFMKKE